MSDKKQKKSKKAPSSPGVNSSAISNNTSTRPSANQPLSDYDINTLPAVNNDLVKNEIDQGSPPESALKTNEQNENNIHASTSPGLPYSQHHKQTNGSQRVTSGAFNNIKNLFEPMSPRPEHISNGTTKWNVHDTESETAQNKNNSSKDSTHIVVAGVDTNSNKHNNLIAEQSDAYGVKGKPEESNSITVKHFESQRIDNEIAKHSGLSQSENKVNENETIGVPTSSTAIQRSNITLESISQMQKNNAQRFSDELNDLLRDYIPAPLLQPHPDIKRNQDGNVPSVLEMEVRHAIAQAARNVYHAHIRDDKKRTLFDVKYNELQDNHFGRGNKIANDMRKLAKEEKKKKKQAAAGTETDITGGDK